MKYVIKEDGQWYLTVALGRVSCVRGQIAAVKFSTWADADRARTRKSERIVRLLPKSKPSLYLIKRKLGGGCWLYYVSNHEENLTTTARQIYAVRVVSKKLAQRRMKELKEMYGDEYQILRLKPVSSGNGKG